MIEQRRQRAKLLPTPPPWAMIHFLPMRRRIQMVIQALQLPEVFVAQVALVQACAEVVRRRRRGDA
jgi:hypothetical protein